jgi:C-terminal processing protease CtpA/Prc
VILVLLLLGAAAAVRAETNLPPAPAGAVAPLVATLGDAAYARRELAQRQLIERGLAEPEPVLDECLRAMAATRDPEVRTRLRQVLAAVVDAAIYRRPRSYLGIQLNQKVQAAADGEPRIGIEVASIVPNSPAARADVQPGDAIRRVDGRDVSGEKALTEFVQYVQSRQPGTRLRLGLGRGADALTIEAVVEPMPAEMQARAAGEESSEEFFARWLRERLEALARSTATVK